METAKTEKDLVVDVGSAEVRIALLENHRLTELNRESNQGQSFTVGDVFLGKVKKLLPALNAAFVDIGEKKIRTAFAADEFYGDTITIMEVLSKHGY